MNQLACVSVVAALALTGCGSICKDLKGVNEDLQVKAQPCDDGSNQGTTGEFNVQQCESDLDKCTDADKQVLEDYISCLRNVGTCVKGQEDAFSGAVLGCASTASGKLSGACTSTVSQEVRRKAASDKELDRQ